MVRLTLWLTGINQLGESTAPRTATVYLSSPGKEVVVPIPVKVDVIVATDANA